MTHAPDDYALIIGINGYPEWNDGKKSLNGAVGDATAFRDWLIDDNGGGLPPENVKLILSQKDPLGPRQFVIDDAFREIRKQSRKKGARRRFYFYFSGHGHSPAGTFQQQALCLANWSPDDAGAALHVESYLKASVGCLQFDEAVFFLDCCRVRAVTPRGQQSELECGTPNTKNRYWAIIYGSDEFEPTYEGEVDGEVRGFMTAGLIKILKEGTIELRDLLDRLREVVAKLAPKEQTVRAVPADTKIYLGPPGPKPPPPVFSTADGTGVTIRVKTNLTGSNNPEDPAPPPLVGHISILRDDHLVARGVGILFAKLEPGLYQVRIDHAEASVTHDLEVGGELLEPEPYELPRRASATLLSSTVDKHEWLTDPVVAASRWDASRGGQAIFLSLRPSSLGDEQDLAGQLLLDGRWHDSKFIPTGNTLHFAQPGIAELRYFSPDGGFSTLPILVAPGWDTHVFILMAEGRPRLATASVSMRPAGVGFDPSDALIDAYERAIADLVTGGPGPDQMTLDSLLWGKYRNPLFGLLGAHFLIRQMRKDAKPNDHALHRLSIIIENLGRLLGEHAPDVVALRLWKQLITKSDRFEAWPGQPPLFSVGFQAFVEASVWAPRDRASDLGEIALGLDANSPWTLWKQEAGTDDIWGSHNHVAGMSTFHASSSSVGRIKVIEDLWRGEGFSVKTKLGGEKVELRAKREGDEQFNLMDQARNILRVPDWLVGYLRAAIDQSRRSNEELNMARLVRRTMLPMDVILAAKSLAELRYDEESAVAALDMGEAETGSAEDKDDGEAMTGAAF